MPQLWNLACIKFSLSWYCIISFQINSYWISDLGLWKVIVRHFKTPWKIDKGSPVSPGQCSYTQVCGCNGCCVWLWLWTGLSPSIFSWFWRKKIAKFLKIIHIVSVKKWCMSIFSCVHVCLTLHNFRWWNQKITYGGGGGGVTSVGIWTTLMYTCTRTCTYQCLEFFCVHKYYAGQQEILFKGVDGLCTKFLKNVQLGTACDASTY